MAQEVWAALEAPRAQALAARVEVAGQAGPRAPVSGARVALGAREEAAELAAREETVAVEVEAVAAREDSQRTFAVCLRWQIAAVQQECSIWATAGMYAICINRAIAS